jgi:hypothetical protein
MFLPHGNRCTQHLKNQKQVWLVPTWTCQPETSSFDPPSGAFSVASRISSSTLSNSSTPENGRDAAMDGATTRPSRRPSADRVISSLSVSGDRGAGEVSIAPSQRFERGNVPSERP